MAEHGLKTGPDRPNQTKPKIDLDQNTGPRAGPKCLIHVQSDPTKHNSRFYVDRRPNTKTTVDRNMFDPVQSVQFNPIS